MSITVTLEPRRGFRPAVQHVDCSEHGRTSWRSNGCIGMRRVHGNSGSRLVPIRETFPGYCPKCQHAGQEKKDPA